MAIAILVGRNEIESKQWQWFIHEWKTVMLAQDPTLDIRIWPDVGNHDEIDFVMVWRHPFDSLNQFKNLKCIASLGAGVDHLMDDTNLNRQVPIVRLLDPYMAAEIVQYVVATVLYYVKRLDVWHKAQQEKTWFRKPPFNFSDKNIGIMGLGYLGQQAAGALHHLKLNVIGWSQSSKNIPGVKTYSGASEFNTFLSETRILVCMLPLTPGTRHILNKDTFSQLQDDAYVINLGRGGHLVEQDLLTSLDNNKLSSAYLDVFDTEPLPSDHPFWVHPKVHVTPHIASVTNPSTAVTQVFENYKRMIAGNKLLNLVDAMKGY
jgi:glyoxylate/hydroxypyruvate reductase A